jgi:hypothetical protein
MFASSFTQLKFNENKGIDSSGARGVVRGLQFRLSLTIHRAQAHMSFGFQQLSLFALLWAC